MSHPEKDLLAVREELTRVLASPGFSRNERLSKFLRFVVESHLDGRDAEIKESVIAIEVLGRSADHDPKKHSIVRTEATRLRARLAGYYAGEGIHDEVVIELPKGGYVPALRRNCAPQGPPVPPMQVAAAYPIRRVWIAIAGVVVLAGGLFGWWWSGSLHTSIAIGVLPLTNLSHEPGSDYVADGLTDEIISNISIIDGLAVRSETSSFALKGKVGNIKDAGQQLNADYILEGSVLQSEQHLRVNVQLVRVRDDITVWSGHYDRELREVMAIQEEVSRGIVNSLRLKLGRGRRRYRIDPEAYDAFLRARSMGSDNGMTGVSASVEPLRKVIQKDPSFAPAYAELALAHGVRSGQFRFNIPEELANMRAAAKKAVDLDPLLAEARDAQAMSYARDTEWHLAEESFRESIRLDPNRSKTRINYALHVLWPLGRLEEALHQAEIAAVADPLSIEIKEMSGVLLMAAGKYEGAARMPEKLPPNAPFQASTLGRARWFEERRDEAIQILRASYNRGPSVGSEIRGQLAFCYARAGLQLEARKIAAETPTINPYNEALIAAGFQDKEATFRALDRAAAGGAIRIGRALAEPEMAFLRGDPGVKELRAKVHLPE